MKEKIVRKLTSRKLWVSVAGFVGLMMTANGSNQSEVAQVSAIIMAGATVVGYVVGEGLTDAANVEVGEGIAMEAEVEVDE